jgi:CelD/BcsL family acetyltransferase involved in cellulose biosynthesis
LLTITEITRHDGIEHLKSEWQALQAQCPALTPFQTWEWNAAWWRHFGRRKRLKLLRFDLVNPDGTHRLVGIAPLYTSRHLGTPLRRLAWVGTGSSDYLMPLALPDWETEVSTLLLTALEAKISGWDMADLQHLRPDCPLMTESQTVWERRPSKYRSLLPIEPCPYVTLFDSWEKFAQSLSKKFRSNIGYYERLAQKTFAEVTYTCADSETLSDGLTALFDLHQKRWNARWLPGVLGNKRVQAFHRDAAARFLANGWLRLHLLHLDGLCHAALYCFAVGNRTFYYLGGFSPELSKYSLGTILTAHAIRTAIREGHSEFDFLRGNEPYKYKWQPQERINHRLLLLRPRDTLGGLGVLPGKAGFALNRVERFVAHRVKLLTEQHGTKKARQ